MEDQEQEKSKMAETIREGAKALFNRLPVSTRLKIIGIAVLAAVGLLLIIIIAAGTIGPLLEVKEKIVDFFEGKTTSSEQFVSIDEYNFYKDFSDINEKYGQYIDAPLILSTLFYSLGQDQTETQQKCYDSTGVEVSCISPIGINYYQKAAEYKQLAAMMMDIKDTTYNCVAVSGTGGEGYTREGKVGESIIDSNNVDILSLSDETCSSLGIVHSYTFSQNMEKFDNYLFNSYIRLHPIRFDLPYFGIGVSDEKIHDVITSIHEKADSFRPLLEGILYQVGGVVFGNIPSSLLSNLGLPLSDPYSITSCMGMRLHPVYGTYTQHNGIDLVSPVRPVYSVYDGVVDRIKVQTDGSGNVIGAGYYIVIKHDIDGAVYYSQYFHLVMDSALVSVGESVNKGQQIATMGSTGVGTGVHLHFELRNASRISLNPGNLFTGAKAVDTSDPNCSLIGA